MNADASHSNDMTPAIDRAVSIMSEFTCPWGVAGGWAIDLFLGRETRLHADLDIAVLRNDQHELRLRLTDARVEKVEALGLTEWKVGEQLELPVHEIHVQYADGLHLEFLLNECDRETNQWLFRRDARVRRAMSAAFHERDGVPYLSPEIVLLYKSKAPATKDDADFTAVVARLGREQRNWLRNALSLTMPGHRWIDCFESAQAPGMDVGAG